ncbi:cation:proton antiporter [Ottowia thiooxydans]|uniref:cation:proton antiporter n=1 Tax=Ottowia thiooxydans TaxID=219182 RepID=UPI0003F867C2|nr:cation:proton antiporter [Ottowia thiooxydans]
MASWLRQFLIYAISVVLAVALIGWILHYGSSLAPAVAAAPDADAKGLFGSMQDNMAHPLSRLFVQLLVIIAAARLAGAAFVRLGLPAVVGEMTAGLLLGPSLLGHVWPQAFAFVFPSDSLGALRLFSQIGICLFMFTVGMELKADHLRHKVRSAVAVSHASIVVPFLLGTALAIVLFEPLAGPQASFRAFALFLGISLSITAFPVLARILQERGMTHTPLGATAIACAAVDDVTAWSIMAFVVAISRSADLAGAAVALVLALLFVVIMLTVVKRFMPRWVDTSGKEPSSGALAVVVCVMVAASLSTELIGIHALFGAFLAGVVMPDENDFRDRIRTRVERFSSVMLLPLFFAFTGLRTEIGLISSLGDWLTCAAIIALATVGKLGATTFAARWTGMGWRDSLQLGALMNTRGLMELIALNIGYDLGILSPRIFTMLVIMALVTTFMTGPLLTLFQRGQSRAVPLKI